MRCLSQLTLLTVITLGVVWFLSTATVPTIIPENEPSTPEEKPRTVLPEPPLMPDLEVRPAKWSFFKHIKKTIQPSSYPNAHSLMRAARHNDSYIRMVRTAVHSSNSGPVNLGQICDLFDYLYDNKIVVSDPLTKEYFTTPIEYWTYHNGDCDDMAICASTACNAIGSFARIVLSQGNKGGHAYAEVCLGNGEIGPYMDYLMARYPSLRGTHYYTEDNGYHWLNLDLNNSSPGGPYFDGKRQHLYYPLVERWKDL